MDGVYEMVKLLAFMLFISSIGAQAWIAVIDIVGHFSQKLEQYRPAPIQDKYSRIVVILGVMILFYNTHKYSLEFTN